MLINEIYTREFNYFLSLGKLQYLNSGFAERFELLQIVGAIPRMQVRDLNATFKRCSACMFFLFTFSSLAISTQTRGLSVYYSG